MFYKNILILFILFSFWKPNAPLAQIDITIDPTTKLQTIKGWGGNFYPQAYQYFLKDTSFVQQSLNELKTIHVRIRSYWYLLEGQNDNNDLNITNWDAIVWGDNGIVHDELLMQQLLFQRDVKLHFAAWRFQFWMVNQSADWVPAFHMLKQFYNYILRVSVPIETNANAIDSAIRSVTFLQPDLQKIALVLINDTKRNFNIPVSVKDYKFYILEVRLRKKIKKNEFIPPSTKNVINLISASVVTAILRLEL